MQGSAQHALKPQMSIAGLIAAAGINGAHIDRLKVRGGFDEALAIAGAGVLGGTTPGITFKWQEASPSAADPETPDAATWADIAGAVHRAIANAPAGLVASVNIAANQTFTLLTTTPPAPSHIMLVIVDSTPSIVAGTVYIVGTREPDLDKGEVGNQAQTEIINCAAGAGTYRSSKVFNTVTSIQGGVVGGVTGTIDFSVLGGAGNETLTAGWENSGADLVQVGRILLRDRKRFLRAVGTLAGSGQTGAVFCGLVLAEPHLKPVNQVGSVAFSV